MIGVLIMMLSISPLDDADRTGDSANFRRFDRIWSKHSQKYFVEQQSCLGEINGQVEETYSGHMVIGRSTAKKRWRKRFPGQTTDCMNPRGNPSLFPV